MSKEHKDLGVERLVADTYKELARERAPDHLNEKVLQHAADHGRTRYARARAWMRPTAWAATIGLCFAIVLELARIPDLEPEMSGVSLSDDRPVLEDRANDEDDSQEPPASPANEGRISETREQFAPKDMDVLRDAEKRARLQAGPDQAAVAREPIEQAPIAEESVGRAPLAEEPMITTQTRKDEVDDDENTPLDEFAATEKAGDFAAVRSPSALGKQNETRADLSCPAASRRTAESWYDCIRELRARGRRDLADSEFEELQRLFPDFVEPQEDR